MLAMLVRPDRTRRNPQPRNGLVSGGRSHRGNKVPGAVLPAVDVLVERPTDPHLTLRWRAWTCARVHRRAGLCG